MAEKDAGKMSGAKVRKSKQKRDDERTAEQQDHGPRARRIKIKRMIKIKIGKGRSYPSGPVNPCGVNVYGRFLRCYPCGDPCGGVRSVRNQPNSDETRV